MFGYGDWRLKGKYEPFFGNLSMHDSKQKCKLWKLFCFLFTYMCFGTRTRAAKCWNSGELFTLKNRSQFSDIQTDFWYKKFENFEKICTKVTKRFFQNQYLNWNISGCQVGQKSKIRLEFFFCQTYVGFVEKKFWLMVKTWKLVEISGKWLKDGISVPKPLINFQCFLRRLFSLLQWKNTFSSVINFIIIIQYFLHIFWVGWFQIDCILQRTKQFSGFGRVWPWRRLLQYLMADWINTKTRTLTRHNATIF